ncbi:hypothetical protein C0416_02075 [bacterium]|nr:hypothetical protein [bacterium]
MIKNVFLMCIIGLVLICICVAGLPGREVQVSFLNVGQGDSIFVRTPDDYFILIDGGPSVSVLEELAEVMPRYNRTIDLVLITHPHADHVNGLVEVVKRFEVKGVMLVGTPSGNTFYQEILRLCGEQGIPIYFGESGRDVKVGSYLYIDVVWPSRSMAGVEFENLNNASLAVRLIMPDKVFMLTGDAEEEEEREILRSGFDLSADIFKAGHHGSKTASSDEFLDAVEPDTVVIQSGAGNSFGHPHKEVLERLLRLGIQVRRNDLEGRVEI